MSCILLGDFNMHWLSDHYVALFKQITDLGFSQHVHNATVQSGSIIDHIYSHNVDHINCETFDTFYSDHVCIHVCLHEK